MTKQSEGRAMLSRCSFLLSFGWPGARGFWFLSFHDGNSAVLLNECLVGYAPDIGLGDFFNLLNLVEELTPVAIERLILAQLESQALVIAQATNEIGLGARLDRLQLFVSYVLGLQLFNLLMNGAGHILRRMALRRRGKKEKQAGIFVPREGAALRGDGNALVAHQ